MTGAAAGFLTVMALATSSANVSDPFKDVDCKKAVAQPELNACADREFQAWDAKLNTLYRGLMKNADEKEQALLKAAEKNWLSFRDSECEWETSGSEGGSIQPMEYSNCLTAKTRARIQELKSAGQ